VTNVNHQGIYAGWKVVLAAATGLSLHFGPVVVITFGVFFIPVQEAFGWDRGQVAAAFAIATIGIALAQPVTGALVDRYGAKRTIMPAAVLFGLMLISLYTLSAALWYFYLLYFFLGVFGSGTTSVPYAKVISGWFDRRRGLALALAIAGSSVGSAIVPPLAQALIGSVGWRLAYVILGSLVICVVLPVVKLFLKERPDPDEPGRTEEMGESHRVDFGMTRREAFRTPVAWILVATFVGVSVAFHACLIHLVPMLRDQGVAADTAAGAASILAVGSLIGRVGTGLLLDHFFAPRVAMMIFLMFSIAVLTFWLAGPLWLTLVGVLLLGLAQGAEFDLMAYMVSRYFGLKQFAGIFSIIFTAFTLGGAIGPPLMGYVFESLGSYQLPLAIVGLFPLVGIVLMSFLGPYPSYAKST
jgi:MFS family permease